MVEVLPSHRIDKKKWDNCINAAGNALVYALSEYLDHTTDNWSGIVLNDYESVMPVPWRRKFGVVYSYNVPFIQQLGIFSRGPQISHEQAMNSLFSLCSYGDYYFNYAQRIKGSFEKTNFVLPLLSGYEEFSASFSPDVKQIVRKAMEGNLTYTDGSIDEAINQFRDLYGGRLTISHLQYESFRKLILMFSSRRNVIVKRVHLNGHTLATSVIIKYGKRLYNILDNTVPEGRKVGANYFLMTNLFREHERSGLLFDFEGSDHPGINMFYRKFGAKNQPYYGYHFNRLPWPLRLIRK